MDSCRQFLAFLSVSGQLSNSQNEDLDTKVLENLFFLENMKPRISSSSPYLDNMPRNENMVVLKLTLLFHR